MRLPAASLGFKLNVALLMFVVVLGAATLAIILYGFNRTQDSAENRSQDALEEQGKVALQALVGGVADAGTLQFESAASIGQRASRYMQDFKASGGIANYDTSRLARTSAGVWYDPDPDRVSDLVVVNHGELEGAVLEDIVYTAALDPLYPALVEGFPGELTDDAYHPIAITFVSVEGVGRIYPPIGAEDNTPAEVDVSDFYDRFGPVANPDRLTVWTPPYEDLQGRGLVMTAQTPVYDGDMFRGIFEVDLSISELVELVNLLKATPRGFTFYVDTDGGIMQTDAYALLTREEPVNPGLAAVLEAMRAPGSPPGVFVETVTLEGEDFFVAYTSMPLPGGALAVAAPVDEVTAQAALITEGIEDEGNRTFAIVLAAMIALFAVGLIGATYMNRRLLLAPLQSLFAGTRAVAAGDLDTRVNLNRGDELGMLADSFNLMVDQLRESERNLEQRVEDRTRELQALMEVSRSMTSTLELRAVFDVVLEQLNALVDYAGASITLREGELFREVAIQRPRGPTPGPGELETAATYEALEASGLPMKGGHLIVDDVYGDSPGARGFRDINGGDIRGTRAEYVRSFIAVALMFQDRLAGMLMVAHDAAGFFTEEHASLLRPFADQATVAIENARLYEEQQRRARELASLLQTSRTLASTLDLAQTLDAILEQLGAIMEHTGASILQIRNDYFEIVAARSTTGSRAEIGSRIPFGASPGLSVAMRRGETVIIDDVRGDAPMAADYRSAIEAIGALDQPPFNVIRSWMAVPLALKDRVLGVLTISWMEPSYFGPEHARLARAFADQAALAVENARLYEQAQGMAALEERQRLARELHDSVSQALYGIALGAQTARKLLDRQPESAVESVDYVIAQARAGMAEMRSLIFELRPQSLEEEGLVAAINKQVEATEARYEFTIEAALCPEPDISLDAKEVLYRICQEAIHNVVKHAHASEIKITLEETDSSVVLTVTDNGAGFDTSADYAGHLGLKSMRERAGSRGGSVELTSGPGGTTVRAELPLPAQVTPDSRDRS